MTDLTTQTPDQLNRRVAELLGWTITGCFPTSKPIYTATDGGESDFEVPDFCADLNAVWGLLPEGVEISIRGSGNSGDHPARAITEAYITYMESKQWMTHNDYKATIIDRHQSAEVSRLRKAMTRLFDSRAASPAGLARALANAHAALADTEGSE